MKNKHFIFKSQMDVLLRGKWKTDFFKNLQDRAGSVVNILIKKFKEKNIYFYDYTEDYEKHHMMLWFYHVGNREYENPYIHDLYLFHEYYHLISFPTVQHTDFNEWKEAMWKNELEASLMSEVYIYYFEPELRKYTFGNTIWFDDISSLFGYEKINVNEDILMFKNHPPIFEAIKNRREAIRNGEPLMFKSEESISSFNNKDNWFNEWRHDFLEVEQIRCEFEKNSKINDFYASSKLNEMLERNTENNVPFNKVALATYKKIGN